MGSFEGVVGERVVLGAARQHHVTRRQHLPARPVDADPGTAAEHDHDGEGCLVLDAQGERRLEYGAQQERTLGAGPVEQTAERVHSSP